MSFQLYGAKKILTDRSPLKKCSYYFCLGTLEDILLRRNSLCKNMLLGENCKETFRREGCSEEFAVEVTERHFDAYYFIDNIQQKQLIAVLKVRLNSLNLIQ